MRSTRCVLVFVLVAFAATGAACARQGVTSVGKAPVEGSATVSAVEGTASGDATTIALPDGSSGSASAVAIQQVAAGGRVSAADLKGRVSGTTRTRTEEWVRVSVKATQPGYETEQVFLSRKLAGGRWEFKDMGTGLGPEDFVTRFGLSAAEADALFGR